MNLESEILEIKERNKKVEAEKAWEVSSSRKILILFLTYIISSSVFYLMGNDNFLINALVPTVGYFISTLSIPFVKNIWIKKYQKGNK